MAKQQSSKSVSAQQKAENGIWTVKTLIRIGAITNFTVDKVDEEIKAEIESRAGSGASKAQEQRVKAPSQNAVVNIVRLKNPKLFNTSDRRTSAYSRILRLKNAAPSKRSLTKKELTKLVADKLLPASVLQQQTKQQKKPQAKQQANPLLRVWEQSFGTTKKKQGKATGQVEGQVQINNVDLKEISRYTRSYPDITIPLDQTTITRYGAPFASMNGQDLLTDNLFAAARLNLIRMYNDVLQTAQTVNTLRMSGGDTSEMMETLKTKLASFIKFMNAVNGTNVTFLFQPDGESTAVRQVSTGYITRYFDENDVRKTLSNLQKAIGVGSVFAGSPDFVDEPNTNLGQVRQGLVSKQYRNTVSLSKNPASAYNRATLVNQLKGLAERVFALKTNGIVSQTVYKSLSDEFRGLVGDVSKMADASTFTDLGSPVRINEARYQFQILAMKVASFQQTVTNSASLQEAIDALTTAKYTKNQLIDAVQAMKDTIEGYENAPQSQLSANVVQKATHALRKLRQAELVMTAKGADLKDAKYAVASLILTDPEVTEGVNLAKAAKNKIVQAQQSKIVAEQKTALAAISQDAYQKDQMKVSLYANPQMVAANYQPFYDIIKGGASVNFTNSVNMVYFTRQQLGNLVSLVVMPMLGDDHRLVDVGAASKLKGKRLDERVLATEAYLSELITTDYLGTASYYKDKPVRQQGVSVQVRTQADTFAYDGYVNKVKSLKAKLEGAKYDGGKGLRVVSFDFNPKTASTTQTKASGVVVGQTATAPTKFAPFAITKAQDLLFMPVFRGDTFYAEGREQTYMQGQQTRGLTQKQGDTTYLARRFGANRQVLNWSPADAEQLRKQYFISLYPFKVTGRFQELLRLEEAKNAVAGPFGGMPDPDPQTTTTTASAQTVAAGLATLVQSLNNSK